VKTDVDTLLLMSNRRTGALKDFDCPLDISAFMDDSPQGLGHGYWMLVLPHIPAQVDARSALLYAIVDEFKDLSVGLTLCFRYGLFLRSASAL